MRDGTISATRDKVDRSTVELLTEAITADKIAEWKAERQVRKLNDRADDAESYAVAAMQIAVAAVDEAETAAIEAVVARIDADAVQSPAKSKAG
jgi:hypothetical protein